MSPTNRAELVLGVVRPTESDRGWARSQQARAAISVVPVRYGRDHLEGLRKKAEAILVAHDARAVMVGVNESENAVEVRGESLPGEAVSELKREIPDDALRVVMAAGGAFRETHGNRFNWNVFVIHQEAGLRVWLPNAFNNPCTTGFYMWSGGFGPFGTTAGHCANGFVGTMVRSPEQSFQDIDRLNVHQASDPSNADVLAFSTASIWNYPRVQNQAGGHWNVMGDFASTWPREWEDICRSGASSDNDQCGNVMSYDQTVLGNDGRRTNHVSCTNIPAAGGDSGGPYYRLYGNGTVRAAGVLKGQIGSWSCFSHIFWVQTQLGMSLVVA